MATVARGEFQLCAGHGTRFRNRRRVCGVCRDSRRSDSGSHHNLMDACTQGAAISGERPTEVGARWIRRHEPRLKRPGGSTPLGGARPVPPAFEQSRHPLVGVHDQQTDKHPGHSVQGHLVTSHRPPEHIRRPNPRGHPVVIKQAGRRGTASSAGSHKTERSQGLLVHNFFTTQAAGLYHRRWMPGVAGLNIHIIFTGSGASTRP